MSRRSENVKTWRKMTKKRIVKAMGDQCCACGYKKSMTALDVHHLDPSKKDFGMGTIIGNSVSWKRIVNELRKCVLLCANCHREHHEGLLDVPKNAPRFDERYTDFNLITGDVKGWDHCPVCNKMKPLYKRTCSRSCGGSLAWSIDWSIYDIKKMEAQGLSMAEIANIVGVSPEAVKKRKHKLYLEERKRLRPSKSQLAHDIEDNTWVAIGRKYKVSDSAVRKWAKKYGLI